MITSQRIFIYLFNVLIVCDCESVVGALASLPNPNQAAGCLNTDQKYWHPSPVSQRNCIFFPRLCTVFALSKLLCWRADYTLIMSLQRRTTQKKKEREREREYEMREGWGDTSFVLFKEQILVASAAYENWSASLNANKTCFCRRVGLVSLQTDVVLILWTRRRKYSISFRTACSAFCWK